VVPALSVRVTPQVAIVPESAIRSAPPPPSPAAPPKGRGAQGASQKPPAPSGARRPANRPVPPAAPARPAPDAPTADREIRVTVVNDTPDAAASVVHLELPQG